MSDAGSIGQANGLTTQAATECCGGGDEGHSCPVLPADGTVRPGPLDGCPTPLSWRQVLDTVRRDARPFQISSNSGVLRGSVYGNGPPLYLLCGMGGTCESFCLLTYLLRETFRCVTFDYNGTRERRSHRFRPRLGDFSSSLFHVADELGDGHFSLFATSFGTLVAQDAMRLCPDRISGAVLQGAFAHRSLSLAERSIIQLGKFLPGHLRSLPFARVVQEQNHKRWFPSMDPSRWQFFLDDAGQVPLLTLSDRGAVINETDLRPVLATLGQRILLIQCEGDGLVSRECHEQLAQGLPSVESMWMHSAGHIPHLTSPHRLAKAIRDFFVSK